MMYHPDRQFEAMHRLTAAIEDARKARKAERRSAWKEAFGAKLVSAGVKIGGRAAAVRVYDAGQLPTC